MNNEKEKTLARFQLTFFLDFKPGKIDVTHIAFYGNEDSIPIILYPEEDLKDFRWDEIITRIILKINNAWKELKDA